jgi:hypothetical protein
VDGLDRRDHRSGNRRCGERRGSADGEEKTTAGLGGTGGQGVAASRTKAELLEERTGSLETPATESAEKFLRAVTNEEQPDRRSR